MKPRFDLSLYLVAGRPDCGPRGLIATVLSAVAGGASIVQLRDPLTPARQLVDDARALKEVLAPLGVPVIVNDRVDVARAADADGVHLGQDDMAPLDARHILGPNSIIGLSAGSPAELAASREQLAAVDYLGVGPIRGSATKLDAGKAIGVEGFAELRALTDLPLVAIGGLGAGQVCPLIQAGAQGVAVVSAICSAADPDQAAQQLVEEIASARR